MSEDPPAVSAGAAGFNEAAVGAPHQSSDSLKVKGFRDRVFFFYYCDVRQSKKLRCHRPKKCEGPEVSVPFKGLKKRFLPVLVFGRKV